MYESYEPWNIHPSLLSGTPGLSMQYIIKPYTKYTSLTAEHQDLNLSEVPHGIMAEQLLV